MANQAVKITVGYIYIFIYIRVYSIESKLRIILQDCAEIGRRFKIFIQAEPVSQMSTNYYKNKDSKAPGTMTTCLLTSAAHKAVIPPQLHSIKGYINILF